MLMLHLFSCQSHVCQTRYYNALYILILTTAEKNMFNFLVTVRHLMTYFGQV